MVRRIYVEKKKGFDVEAQGLRRELAENLRLTGLRGLRVLNRYDVENIDDETYGIAVRDVFSEPPADVVYEEVLPPGGASVCFGTEYLPGQYDRRADAAAQCIRLIKSDARPAVRFARMILIEGDLDASEIAAVKKFIINPTDSREADPEKPNTLTRAPGEVPPVRTVEGFTNMDAGTLAAYREAEGFAMSEADLLFVQRYFAETERRDPTVTEIKVIDTYWSDHCRHTTFNTRLTDISFARGERAGRVRDAFETYRGIREAVYGSEEAARRDMTLMDIALIGAKYLKKRGLIPDLDESEEINACGIRVPADVDGRIEDWLVLFKNETHNHPTEIEPFGGAATCLGGAIRDPLSGRAYVYQAMRVTGSGDPRADVRDTLPGKLPQLRITRDAAEGYSSYGNQIGIATGQVEEIYDEGYVAKRMEIGAVIGAAPAERVRRERPAPGDAIILVGGRTGRDGCGGATGSSKEHTADSVNECGAEVQKGNPPVERNIQRLFARAEVVRLIKRCNDFGAGGVSVAIGELADGIDVNLDLIPKKYEGLDGTELAISESQERMAVVVADADAAAFIAFADEENTEATRVATVTDTGRFRMFFRERRILDLSRDFLNTNGVRQSVAVFVAEGAAGGGDISENADPVARITDALDDLNACSRKGLIERFDSTIGAGTVLMPLGGRRQETPAMGMAAKLPVWSGETDTVTLMSFGYDPEIAKADPFLGALGAVVESVTKIVAMGGDRRRIRLSFQEYFEKLGGEPARFGKPFAALLGALRAQLELEIPAIGGKDSMSGSFMDMDVPPTLVSFAVCAASASRVVSPEFKVPDSTLVFVGGDRGADGALDFAAYRAAMDRVAELTAAGVVLSASVIGPGGLFVTCVKATLGNEIGAHMTNVTREELRARNGGALLIEIGGEKSAGDLFAGLSHRVIGRTTTRRAVTAETVSASGEAVGPVIDVALDEAERRMGRVLEKVFPTATNEPGGEVKPVAWEQRALSKPAVRAARPKVVIPVFPGTNCETDSARAFERAGAEPALHVLRNLTPDALDASIMALAARIGESRIIMIPGGFSGGDEPDGSAKFITAVFRNPRIREAVTELLERRDGLILGICNGFQALVKLGLLPFGRIADATADSPTLTYNAIGRHVSRLVTTRVASVLSPWLAGVRPGELHTIPVSHGEGRFVAPDALIETLIQNGQIATQYADDRGAPTNDMRFNPNGSRMAIEGITSPDGRVFGKMGHSERIGANLYRNVPGNRDQKLFESGVAYFR